MTKLSRRKLIKGAVAAGISAAAAPSPITANANLPATEPTKPDPNAITATDIAAAERISGLSTNDVERALMLKSLADNRKALSALRVSDLTVDQEPAAHFTPRLAGMALPTGRNDCRVSRAPLPTYKGSPDTLAFHTLTDLSRLVKARKATSVELTRMYLDRLKTFGPRLLCVVSLIDEGDALRLAAQADAEIADGNYRGPLHGIPYGVKDLLAAEATRTTFGAKPFANQVWNFDSTVVARLNTAGAILLAKLSMGELAMGDVWFGGKTRNPWKPTTGSSGSSAGPASATAAGLVGFTIGTETLGSIVSPCRVCGTTGLRPTNGRVSRHGAMPLSWTMDKIGPICRGVEDCALVFAAIQGPDGLDPTLAENIPFRWNPRSKLSDLRVGFDERAMGKLKESKEASAADVIRAVEEAVATLKTLGVHVTPLQLPVWHDEYDAVADVIIGVEGAASFARLRADGGLEQLAQQDDWNWPNTFRVAATIPAPDYVQALRVRAYLQRAMADALKDFDAYVTIPRFGPSLLYTNLTGNPTVITRCGKAADGMPLSIEFTGALYREDAILRLAFAFERATEWHRLWPDTAVLPETAPELEKAG